MTSWKKLASASLALLLLTPLHSTASQWSAFDSGMVRYTSLEQVQLLQRYLHGSASLTNDQASNADFNMDGCVNGFDLAILKKARQDEDFPIRTSLRSTFSTQSLPASVNAAVCHTQDELMDYLTALGADESSLADYQKTCKSSLFDSCAVAAVTFMDRTGGDYEVVRAAYADEDTLRITLRLSTQAASWQSTYTTAKTYMLTLPQCLLHENTEVVWEIVEEGYAPSFDMTLLNSTEAFYEAAKQGVEAAIYSADELETFLSPLLTTEDLAAMQTTYDEAYFAENMVFLKTFFQPCGEGCWFAFTSDALEMTEYSLTIPCTDLYHTPEMHGTSPVQPDVEHAVLAQVGMPKAQAGDRDANWEYVDSAFRYPTYTVTSSLLDAGESITKSIVQSGEELEAVLEELTDETAVASLKNTYDAAFFEENTLLLFTDPVSASNRAQTVDYLFCNDLNNMLVYTTYHDYTGEEGVLLHQIILPKRALSGLTIR